MMNMKHWIWFLILIPKMNKSEHYQKYADYTATMAVNSGSGWMDFLDTMAQNSKRSIPELLLIHFQRPDASDCRSYQEWMKAGCQVRRGAIGVAVPDNDNPEKMQYLFGREDIVRSSQVEKNWKVYADLEDDAVRALERAFGTTGTKDFRQQVDHAVNLALDDYWAIHDTEVIGNIMDCMKEWGEYNAKLQFMDAAYFSANYMILQRCGKHPRYSIYESDFFCVRDFSSPKAMATLGEAVRVVGNRVLDVIEKAITERTVQRNNSILAEGEQSPSAFSKPKSHKKETEVR